MGIDGFTSGPADPDHIDAPVSGRVSETPTGDFSQANASDEQPGTSETALREANLVFQGRDLLAILGDRKPSPGSLSPKRRADLANSDIVRQLRQSPDKPWERKTNTSQSEVPKLSRRQAGIVAASVRAARSTGQIGNVATVDLAIEAQFDEGERQHARDIKIRRGGAAIGVAVTALAIAKIVTGGSGDTPVPTVDTTAVREPQKLSDQQAENLVRGAAAELQFLRSEVNDPAKAILLDGQELSPDGLTPSQAEAFEIVREPFADFVRVTPGVTPYAFKVLVAKTPDGKTVGIQCFAMLPEGTQSGGKAFYDKENMEALEFGLTDDTPDAEPTIREVDVDKNCDTVNGGGKGTGQTRTDSITLGQTA